MSIIGRDREINILNDFLKSKKPEFLALYGRRRVGKTFLIREFFKKNKGLIFFNATGLKDGKLADQLANIVDRISEVFYDGIRLGEEKNWRDAFKALNEAIKRAPKNKKIIIFLDELPWMATPKSKLLQTLDYYWNQYWSQNNKVKLIVCGSSASWIINNIINNRGGLHNRITENIKLKPFDLYNTKKYLDHQGINLNSKQIMLLYLSTGGIPFYLSKIKWNTSAVQIIEKLAFRENSFFLQEFDNLFSSLFDDDEIYIKIVKILAKSRDGIGKTQLLDLVGSVGSNSAKRLKDLENAGFIISFKPAYHKRQGIYYRLIDEYTSFYLRWLEPLKQTLQEHSLDKGSWQEMRNTPEWHSWLGYAFESLCYKHLIHIRRALELQPSAIAHAWRHIPRKNTATRGAQIDLLFDRRDDAVTICEIKYSDKPYVITKDYANKIKQKLTVFREQTKTTKNLFVAFISAAGLNKNAYAKNLVGCTVNLDDLFKEID